MPNVTQMPGGGGYNIAENLSNIERVTQHTQPKGKEFFDFFNIRLPILGKEAFLGFIRWEDLKAYDFLIDAINENLHHGLIEKALEDMVKYENNFRSTASINGEFMKRITSQEFKYTQDQKITEITQPTKKKGIIFNR